ncbi:hypothetical protein QAD02_009593 [Eretmocerus hayati]|uniref:Uncharacterized protein n=1 Tax=Eretmocerus hayati TaxID=131215 RepID=A0ACC2N9T1_9HYME|nr:hypothetical protein QAD02_009593 [Eretmocerus hayati]
MFVQLGILGIHMRQGFSRLILIVSYESNLQTLPSAAHPGSLNAIKSYVGSLPSFAVLTENLGGCRRRHPLPAVSSTSGNGTSFLGNQVPATPEENQVRVMFESSQPAAEHNRPSRPPSNHELLSHGSFDKRSKRRRPEGISTQQSFSCEFCSKTFGKKHELTRHLKAHSDVRPFSCELCNKKFKRKPALNKHKKSCSSDRSHFSELGNNENFERGRDLNNHMLSHEDKNHFTCGICGKNFKRKHTLKGHMESHSNENSLTCVICRKKIAYGFNMKSHMDTHKDDRPFTCNICNKGFRRKSALEDHKKIHTKIKTFSCQLCNEKYRSMHDLKQHVKEHRNKEPFTCDQCGKPCKYESKLQRHLKTHSEEEFGRGIPASNTCSENLECESDLVEHERIHEQNIDVQEPGTIVEVAGQSEQEIPVEISHDFTMENERNPRIDYSYSAMNDDEMQMDQPVQPTERSSDLDLIETSINQIQNNPELFGSWVRMALESVDGSSCDGSEEIDEGMD